MAPANFYARGRGQGDRGRNVNRLHSCTLNVVDVLAHMTVLSHDDSFSMVFPVVVAQRRCRKCTNANELAPPLCPPELSFGMFGASISNSLRGVGP